MQRRQAGRRASSQCDRRRARRTLDPAPSRPPPNGAEATQQKVFPFSAFSSTVVYTATLAHACTQTRPTAPPRLPRYAGQRRSSAARAHLPRGATWPFRTAPLTPPSRSSRLRQQGGEARLSGGAAAAQPCLGDRPDKRRHYRRSLTPGHRPPAAAEVVPPRASSQLGPAGRAVGLRRRVLTAGPGRMTIPVTVWLKGE